MESRVSDKYLNISVLVTSVTVCLVIAPTSSIDPFNLPKMCMLIVTTFFGVGIAFSKVEFFQIKKSREILIVLVLFVLQLFLVLFADRRDFSLKFYGVFGRNTGFITYLCLAFLLLTSAICASKVLLRRYVVAVIATGTLLALYGLAQSSGFEFYQFNNAYGSNVFGSFGNPNFQSAFMGLFAAVVFTFALLGSGSYKKKFGLSILGILAVYNIAQSSQQGYYNFVAGVMAAIIVFFFSSKKSVYGWSALVGSGIVTIFLLLGILNTGPLADFVYKSSLMARGFYWQAAMNMMLKHPFFGVGMDGFGDSYFRFRTTETALYGVSISADSAHSVPLDIGSYGGLPLFFGYVGLMVLVVISIKRVLKRAIEFDVFFAALVAAWVAYVAQSLISINQLGLGVWGWSISGLIIGYELNTRPSESGVFHKSTRAHTSSVAKSSKMTVVLVCLFTSASLVIALPPYVAAAKFYRALQSGDPALIQQAAYLKPNDRMRFLYVAQALQENKFEFDAITVLRDASQIYPDSFEIWQRWSKIPSASAAEVTRAKAEMTRLDPFNPELK